MLGSCEGNGLLETDQSPGSVSEKALRPKKFVRLYSACHSDISFAKESGELTYRVDDSQAS